MKRGQIVGRQFVIIGSWIVLFITLAFAFIMQSYAQSGGYQLGAFETTSAPATLSTYLRQSVTLNGAQVPLAELIAWSVTTKNYDALTKETDAFLKKVSDADRVRIVLTLPNGETKEFGEETNYGETTVSSSSATAKIPLPNGESVQVQYIASMTRAIEVGEGGI